RPDGTEPSGGSGHLAVAGGAAQRRRLASGLRHRHGALRPLAALIRSLIPPAPSGAPCWPQSSAVGSGYQRYQREPPLGIRNPTTQTARAMIATHHSAWSAAPAPKRSATRMRKNKRGSMSSSPPPRFQ